MGTIRSLPGRRKSPSEAGCEPRRCARRTKTPVRRKFPNKSNPNRPANSSVYCDSTLASCRRRDLSAFRTGRCQRECDSRDPFGSDLRLQYCNHETTYRSRRYEFAVQSHVCITSTSSRISIGLILRHVHRRRYLQSQEIIGQLAHLNTAASIRKYANSSNDKDTGFNIQKYVEKSLRLFKFHALMLIIVIGKMPVTTVDTRKMSIFFIIFFSRLSTVRAMQRSEDKMNMNPAQEYSPIFNTLSTSYRVPVLCEHRMPSNAHDAMASSQKQATNC
ncbi:hypothetical protein T02_6602 [Trichinella nativa]|uniref:Uncharacterized protein n=1 Tax=Trichinella nativa TaxID=6335 RepID=A0A0V1L4P6_9BILA|nr:hypothetical protein T02_6602 [Trichinella nativa]